MVDPRKRAFLSFEIKTFKKMSSYFSLVLALQAIDAQMFLPVIFKRHNEVINRQKRPKLRFLTVDPKIINIWASWNLMRVRRSFGFELLKSYLTFGYLTCSDR